MAWINTQLGLTSCLPKTKPGETQPRSTKYPHGYTKRHGNKTSNRLPTDIDYKFRPQLTNIG
jgi:hypothetical protein